MRVAYYYWLYDKKSGCLLYEGTAAQIVAQGAYDDVHALGTQYRQYQNGRTSKYDFDREQLDAEHRIRTRLDIEDEQQFKREQAEKTKKKAEAKKLAAAATKAAKPSYQPQGEQVPIDREKMALHTQWVNVYTCYDENGEKMAEGTAMEIAAQGIFKNPDAVRKCFFMRGGKSKIYGIGRMEMIRQLRSWWVPKRGMTVNNCVENVEKRANSSVMNAPTRPQAQPRPRRLPKDKNSDPLTADVHDLCVYNKLARKQGLKELSYGYWAAKGKPSRP